MIVELYIFYLKEEQIMLQNTGQEIPLSDCVAKKFGFVNIDYFSERNDSPQFTIIGSGGDEFISTENYQTVYQKIQQASIFKFN